MIEKTNLYAWVVREADGVEGPIAAGVLATGPVPLVTAKLSIAESLMGPFAVLHAERTGKPVRLVRFEEAEELRTI